MSSSDGNEKRIFGDDVPLDFVRESLQCLLDSYAESFAYCKGRLNTPELRYLHPHMQRAIFEGDWRRLARNATGGKGQARRNAKGDSHTRCIFGRVILTQSAVQAPYEFPRKADFRDTLAQGQQTSMLAALGYEDDTTPAGALYAILTHGPRRHNSPLPAFIRIGFPARDCDGFVDFIDLTPLLHRTTEPTTEPPVEQPPEENVDPLVVRLRSQLKVGNKDGA